MKSLRAIDRLEVGPVRVEARRVVAPYRVHQNGKSDETEFAYRFEEDVLDPADPAAFNLASMMTAQLALNYGLFCREIVFHGAFEDIDRRFIDEYMENTAREIYVNKFLKPNPFLTGPAAGMQARKMDRYCGAKIVYPDDAPEGAGGGGWRASSSRHAVLSSGGKDSLLTFGLLHELGHEVHSLFVNESGRHWYTALNAYRRLSSLYPETSRVWTNSDRLFSWMLRHLPFIRPDFAKVRSDEYPIRLWTVAVFLFGVLPLMRKRGLGRLLIGDEYDTTVRRSEKGITHYAGLFDQSRWFDNGMTRYFQKKGWGISQFSALRPCSELLIEKILVERYPDLQRLQVSCHAAHLEDGKALPCGRCEKCRRIVGMLVALGADPRRCGYTRADIAACLRAFAREGVHQESAGARHTMYLLQQREAVERDAQGAVSAKPHPEVLRLRFHSEQSPVESVPRDLREGLHRIFMQHAEGAVERHGKQWRKCDPLGEPILSRPYAFEVAAGTRGGAGKATGGEPPGVTPHLLAEMNWPEAQEAFKRVDVALLPVGSIEQHGPHLPLDTDAWDADYLCRKVAEACSDPRPIVLPLIAYGVSYHHEDFSGTFSVSPNTLAQLVHEIGMDAARNGITKLVIINGHGGNAPALHLAAQSINRDAHIFTCVDTGETSDADVAEMLDAPNDVHAGEIETSTTLAVRPDLVRMDKARKMVPRFSSKFLDFTSRRSVGWYARTARISRSGVMGDATKASREKGEKIWEIMTSRLVELVEDLKKMTLDEIYQRRY